MGLAAYFTLFVIAVMIICLALELASADFLLFAALTSVMLTGIVSPSKALIGFANKGMLTVALLFIVSEAIQKTGALDNINKYFLGREQKRNLSLLLLKMMPPVSFLSAFLNNTPIVVIFVPAIKKWAERLNLPPSKFLIPLSYATIFGGVCTLIGTSTNLVVHGLMLDNNLEGFSMFELAKVGVPCAIVGWIYLITWGKNLLPDRQAMTEIVGGNRKEYVVEMKVQPHCELIGKTIQEAGLRNLKGLFLIGIERNNISLAPVSGEEKITNEDRLMFVGITSAVVELTDISGLVPVAPEMSEKDFSSLSGHFVEAVVSSSFPFVGKTIKECKFRAQYGAGVMAVHRNGERIESKIGSIKLRVGDTLLLLATQQFINNWRNSQDFYLISNVKAIKPKPKHKAYIAIAIAAGMVLTATFGKQLPKLAGVSIGMLHAAFGAAFLLIIARCVKVSEARKSIKWEVLITIACAFGLSKALQNSGAASSIASCIINLVQHLGPVGVLGGIYLITTIFTELITNNAAAALIFPIALSAATQLNVNPKPFFIAIAIAASASFATPIGYQTNLIVQGAGGYKFKDYLKVGLPLNILFWLASILIIPLFWSF